MNPNDHTEQIMVEWDQSMPDHSLTVTPYNQMDAKGDVIDLQIEIQQQNENVFQFQNSDWSYTMNWSLLHSPIACEDVAISDSELPTDIIIMEKTAVNSINIGTNIHLILNDNLLIHQKLNTAAYPALDLRGSITNNSSLILSNNAPEWEAKIHSSGTLTNNGNILLEK